MSQRGSHVKMAKVAKTSRRVVTLPVPAELVVGTLRPIVRQSGLPPEVFD